MKKVFVVFLLFLAVGCAKKYVTSPDEGVTPGEEAEMEEVMREDVEPAISPREAEDVESTSIAEKELMEFQDALFDYDRYEIRPDARQALDAVASWLNSHKDAQVLIEGHCDERGTNEYNLALGERRAKAARDYLVSRGISHIRISIVTYGEEKPICLEQDEECWQRNRRAHFVITK